MPTLADIYNYIDSQKRQAGNFIRQPISTLQEMIALGNDEARQINRQTALSAQGARKELRGQPMTQEQALADQELQQKLMEQPQIGGIKVSNFSNPKVLSGKLYETTQEGPFYRVRSQIGEGSNASRYGIRETNGPSGATSAGLSRSELPKYITDEEVKSALNNPENIALKSANKYTKKFLNKEYSLPAIPESSLFKQSPIGRTFELAATDSPAYKKVIFDAYKKQHPKIVEKSGANNYDELRDAAYKQLEKETVAQFRHLPVNLSYHKAGEGNYLSSNEMLKDVYGNKHLYVYQGGDKHDYLHNIDPHTGLNSNEMFRAIHDFYGHATHGNQFGPKGEEIAYAAHSSMFSPLAKFAMAAETRGQNSFVNYSPINAELKSALSKVEEALYDAKKRNLPDEIKKLSEQKQKLYEGFQYAPQKSVLLPPEFVSTEYKGGMPDYLQSLITSNPETRTSANLVHYSNVPNLISTNPAMYGSGIKGQEAARMAQSQGNIKDRTYFYVGEPNQIIPEPGLGAHKYISNSENLYDLANDPLNLFKLTQEANRSSWNAPYNQGIRNKQQELADLERVIKEYGYEGYLNTASSKPAAVLFYPKNVTKVSE